MEKQTEKVKQNLTSPIIIIITIILEKNQPTTTQTKTLLPM